MFLLLGYFRFICIYASASYHLVTSNFCFFLDFTVTSTLLRTDYELICLLILVDKELSVAFFHELFPSLL
jgi:hypothetical protein